MKKKITFFYTDHLEKNTWKNLKKKAYERGFATEFSKDLSKNVEIGFYNHDRSIKNNAKISVISIHGMDQCRNLWPNPWVNMRWDYYDVGLLPGNRWSKMWSKASFDPYAIPKKGVFNVGWPKSDAINSNKFKLEKNKIKKKLNSKKKTILYAPSMETDNKQLDILDLAIKLNVNLIIKHWPSKEDKRVSDIYKNIVTANKISKKRYKDVTILPPKSDIFTCLSPCIIGYGEIGYKLSKIKDWKKSKFSSWIKMYSSKEYQKIAMENITYLDILFKKNKNIELSKLKQKFKKSTVLERNFWQCFVK